jgi:hypothetical protein
MGPDVIDDEHRRHCPGELAERVEDLLRPHRYARAVRDPGAPREAPRASAERASTSGNVSSSRTASIPVLACSALIPPPAAAAECPRRLVIHAGCNQASRQVCSSSAAAVVATWRQSAKPQRRREAANQAPDNEHHLGAGPRPAPSGQIAAMRGRFPRVRTSRGCAHPPRLGHHSHGTLTRRQ